MPTESYPGQLSGRVDPSGRFSEDWLTSWCDVAPGGAEYEEFKARQAAIGRPIEHAQYDATINRWFCYIPSGRTGVIDVTKDKNAAQEAAQEEARRMDKEVVTKKDQAQFNKELESIRQRKTIAESASPGEQETSPGDPENGTCLAGYEHLDYKPLWDFILVEPVKEQEKVSAGGIVFPETSKVDDTRRCKVIMAGPGCYQNGTWIHNPIKVGQYIFNMTKHLQPHKVMLNNVLYLSMPSSEVLAVAQSSGYVEEKTDHSDDETGTLADK